jgi:site-specific DNA-methyltransferase (adenine-specific)
MGSGTTAKIAHLLKRRWIGSEISQEYVDIAMRRLSDHVEDEKIFA